MGSCLGLFLHIFSGLFSSPWVGSRSTEIPGSWKGQSRRPQLRAPGTCTHVFLAPARHIFPMGWWRRVKGQCFQVAGGLRVATLALSTWQVFSHEGVPHSFQAASHSHTPAGKRALVCFNYLASYCPWIVSCILPWSIRSPARWNSCPHFPPQFMPLPSPPLCSSHIEMGDKGECLWFQQNLFNFYFSWYC